MTDTTTIDPPTIEADDALPTAERLATAERGRERAEALAIFAFVFAAISVLTALFAVGLSVRAVQRADSIENPPAASGGVASDITLTLTEFKITPDTIEVPAGSVITVVNDGTTAHDVQVEGITSDTVDAGKTTTLDLAGLEPGTYDMICTVTGHKDSGMTGTITIT